MSDRKAMLKELQEISFTADDLTYTLIPILWICLHLKPLCRQIPDGKTFSNNLPGNLNPLPETVSALIQTISPASVPTTPDRNILPGPTGLCPGIVKEVFSDVDL